MQINMFLGLILPVIEEGAGLISPAKIFSYFRFTLFLLHKKTKLIAAEKGCRSRGNSFHISSPFYLAIFDSKQLGVDILQLLVRIFYKN